MTQAANEARVAEVAAGLTKASRDWLISPGYVDPNTIRALRRRGIIVAYQRGLTPLGLAVRALLSENPHAD